MAEGARLESVYTRNRIEGSNPSLTAKLKKKGPDENQDPFSFVLHLDDAKTDTQNNSGCRKAANEGIPMSLLT